MAGIRGSNGGAALRAEPQRASLPALASASPWPAKSNFSAMKTPWSSARSSGAVRSGRRRSRRSILRSAEDVIVRSESPRPPRPPRRQVRTASLCRLAWRFFVCATTQISGEQFMHVGEVVNGSMKSASASVDARIDENRPAAPSRPPPPPASLAFAPSLTCCRSAAFAKEQSRQRREAALRFLALVAGGAEELEEIE